MVFAMHQSNYTKFYFKRHLTQIILFQLNNLPNFSTSGVFDMLVLLKLDYYYYFNLLILKTSSIIHPVKIYQISLKNQIVDQL